MTLDHDDHRVLLDSLDRIIARHLPMDEQRRRDADHSPPYDLLPVLGAAGLLRLPFPEAVGGLGGDWQTVGRVQEHLGQHAWMLGSLFNRAVGFGGMSLMTYGQALPGAPAALFSCSPYSSIPAFSHFISLNRSVHVRSSTLVRNDASLAEAIWLDPESPSILVDLTNTAVLNNGYGTDCDPSGTGIVSLGYNAFDDLECGSGSDFEHTSEDDAIVVSYRLHDGATDAEACNDMDCGGRADGVRPERCGSRWRQLWRRHRCRRLRYGCRGNNGADERDRPDADERGGPGIDHWGIRFERDRRKHIHRERRCGLAA